MRKHKRRALAAAALALCAVLAAGSCRLSSPAQIAAKVADEAERYDARVRPKDMVALLNAHDTQGLMDIFCGWAKDNLPSLEEDINRAYAFLEDGKITDFRSHGGDIQESIRDGWVVFADYGWTLEDIKTEPAGKYQYKIHYYWVDRYRSYPGAEGVQYIRIGRSETGDFSLDADYEVFTVGKYLEYSDLLETYGEPPKEYLDVSGLVIRDNVIYGVDSDKLILVSDVIIPDGITGIGDYVFKDTRFEHVTFPDSLRTIGTSCFCYNNLLTGVYIPAGVEYIGPGAFSTDSITIDENNPYYVIEDGIIFTKDRKKLTHYLRRSYKYGTSYAVPEGVEVIGKLAFRGSGLEEIILSESLREIEEEAFADCGLEEIVLPESLREIGNRAFTGCKLTRLDIPAGVQKIGKYALYFYTPTEINYPGTREQFFVTGAQINTDSVVHCSDGDVTEHDITEYFLNELQKR